MALAGVRRPCVRRPIGSRPPRVAARSDRNAETTSSRASARSPTHTCSTAAWRTATDTSPTRPHGSTAEMLEAPMSRCLRRRMTFDAVSCRNTLYMGGRRGVRRREDGRRGACDACTVHLDVDIRILYPVIGYPDTHVRRAPPVAVACSRRRRARRHRARPPRLAARPPRRVRLGSRSSLLAPTSSHQRRPSSTFSPLARPTRRRRTARSCDT